MLTGPAKKFGATKKTPFQESDIERLLAHEATQNNYQKTPSRMSSLLLEKIGDLEPLIDRLSPAKVVEWLRLDPGQFWMLARLKMESLKDSKDKNALMGFLKKYSSEMSLDDVRENTKHRGMSSSEPRWNSAVLYVLFERCQEFLTYPLSPENLNLYFTLKILSHEASRKRHRNVRGSLGVTSRSSFAACQNRSPRSHTRRYDLFSRPRHCGR